MKIELKTLKTKLTFIRSGGKYRPILSSIKVTEKGLFCTDLETYLHVKCNYDLGHGLQSLDTLGLLPSRDDVDDSYPEFTNDFKSLVSKPESVSSDIEELFYCLKFASKDETRIYLNCVAFDSGHMIAVDGHMLKSYPTSKKLKESYLIPRTSLKILEGLIKAYKIKGNLTFTFDDSFAYIDCSDFSLKSRLIKREFPNWKHVMPTKYCNEFNVTNIPSFKDVKPLLNRNNGIILNGIDGQVTMSIVGQELSYVIGNYDDTKMSFKIGVNMTYLEVASKSSKAFKVKWNTEMGVLLINEAIVMPLKDWEH